MICDSWQGFEFSWLNFLLPQAISQQDKATVTKMMYVMLIFLGPFTS